MFREVLFAVKIIRILLWSFGPFSGQGLSVARVSLQLNFCELSMVTPRPIPDLESQRMSVRPASGSCQHGM
jgi:hypothetical protein